MHASVEYKLKKLACQLVGSVVALRVEGDEGVALMKVEFVQLVNAKLLPPLDVLRPKFLGTRYVVLPRTQEPPQHVDVPELCSTVVLWPLMKEPC